MLTNPTQIRPTSKTFLGSDVSLSYSDGRKAARSVRFPPLVHCKKAFGQNYDEKIYAAVPDMSGAEVAELGKVKLFIARCYKALTTISTTDEDVLMNIAILGTEAGPNLIRENVLSTMGLENVQPVQEGMKAAHDTTFRVEGVLQLSNSWYRWL